MDYVLKQSLRRESVHKGLEKSAGELSHASTVDFMVGQPRAVVDLLKLYIKVCESVTGRLGRRLCEEGRRREMWKWRGKHWRQ